MGDFSGIEFIHNKIDELKKKITKIKNKIKFEKTSTQDDVHKQYGNLIKLNKRLSKMKGQLEVYYDWDWSLKKESNEWKSLGIFKDINGTCEILINLSQKLIKEIKIFDSGDKTERIYSDSNESSIDYPRDIADELEELLSQKREKMILFKKLKDFPKERNDLFELSKKIKTLTMDKDSKLFYDIIELRILRNQLNHIIKKFEEEESVGGQVREFYDDWEREEKELRYDMSKGFSQEDIEHIVKLEKEER